MKSHGTKSNPMRAAGVLAAALLLSQAAWSAPGGNGNGNGTAAQLAALQAEVEALQADVAILFESIALLGVNTVDADCSSDPGALQAAIDAAPPAGAIILVEGSCDEATVTGKANLLIDGAPIGDGNGVTGALVISSSNNIQLSGMNAGSMMVSNSASVLVDDLNVAGDVTVEVNGALTQDGGTVTITGGLAAWTGARIDIEDASVADITQSRNTSIILNAIRADGTAGSITVNGQVGVFSGSHFLAQANSAGGSVVMNGDLIAQRTSAALLAGEGVVLNANNVLARQNAVIDFLGLLEANFNVGSVNLLSGAGSRLIYLDSSSTFAANCDPSAWVDVFMTCAP